MQDWQRHIYGCWLPTITGGTHSEGFQLKSKSTFLLVIAFPPSHCVCTARVHVCPRVDVCEVGTKFNDTEISQPGLAIRLAPNIDSFNPVCYNFSWSLWLRKSTKNKSCTFLLECVSVGAPCFISPVDTRVLCVAAKIRLSGQLHQYPWLLYCSQTHTCTRWWSERNRPDTLAHCWMGSLMDWGYLVTRTHAHTQLVMEWSHSLSSPHAQ